MGQFFKCLEYNFEYNLVKFGMTVNIFSFFTSAIAFKIIIIIITVKSSHHLHQISLLIYPSLNPFFLPCHYLKLSFLTFGVSDTVRSLSSRHRYIT